ncbi:CPBP family glutamic-type intramembrane protease [Paracoccus methylarcula]|uniref:CPBP family glutamic-type intramembrane protease n=1 Tax=Paracoccus methylarcula TaxID=72022 RepID=UPI001FE5BE2B|nr:CPBP family glutamic-type intramembrane protease [Paracoccus methylarcula]
MFLPASVGIAARLIFRPLFFHRYGSLLPEGRGAIAINALIFSFAHLMYWSWVVAAMTFVGGWIFARAYLRHGFPAAWILHAVAGNLLFAVGMGYYFWSSNVVRPF